MAAVLHLGNISFAQSDRDEAELEGSLSHESLAKVSELLEVRVPLNFRAEGLGPKAAVLTARTGDRLGAVGGASAAEI